MPKTTSTTTTRRHVIVKGDDGETYLLSSKFLRDYQHFEDVNSDGSVVLAKTEKFERYYLKLSELLEAIENGTDDYGTSGTVSLYTIDGETMKFTKRDIIFNRFGVTYTPRSKSSNGKAHLSIGCRHFTGRTAERIVAAARRTAKTKAAAA